MKTKQLIEAALFVSTNPLSLEELSKITGEDKEKIEKLVKELMNEYKARESAIEIRKIGDNQYFMQAKDAYAVSLMDLVKPAISQPILKTLSLIALKQPITQAEVVKARGASAYSHVKELLNKEFISAQRKGRTKVLRTTKKFSDYFGFSYDIEKIKKEIAGRLRKS